MLLVKKLSENARLPKRATEFSAGYDLYSAHDEVIPANGTALIKTDIAISFPDGCYGRIASRSGLALRHSIQTGGGVIDADYRGNVGIILFNHSSDKFSVSKGDRVAQLILEKIIVPNVCEVNELESSVRGSKGFGSSGVN